MRKLFDRTYEIPAPLVATLLDGQDSVQAASPFAFLLNDVQPVDRGSVKQELVESLAESIDIAAAPEVGVTFIEHTRSRQGNGFTAVTRGDRVAMSFVTPRRTCLISVPLSLHDFVTRMIEDIGSAAEGDESPTREGGDVLIVSGQLLPPDGVPNGDAGARHALFVGPSANRWLVVPPPIPSDEARFLRLDREDLYLFLSGVFHRETTVGEFGRARSHWERALDGLS